MTCADIRKFSKKDWRSLAIAEIICMYISPIFSKWFISKKLRPNTVTVLMIVCGILGSLLFMVNHIEVKIIGICFLWLWFIMDCSDGEVARVTKQFSPYGKEMDQLAHLITHPLVNLSIYISYVQSGIDMFNLSIMALVFISFEMIYRAFVIMDTYLTRHEMIDKEQKFCWIKYIFAQCLYMPNFILFFPIFLVCSLLLDLNTIVVLYLWMIVYVVNVVRLFALRLCKFYRE